MKIQDNPYVSETFTSCWIDHFQPAVLEGNFGFFENMALTRSGRLPLYTNIGRNHTKGISYELNPKGAPGLNGNVVMIYDVPGYFGVPTKNPPPGIGCFRVRQYPGYLIDLASFDSLEQYLQQFSKASRYKLKKYRKRLESAFDIEYVTYYGQLERETYDSLFTAFRDLLVKRFEDKQVHNNNLDEAEWEFYRKVTYPMILEKKANLFVIYACGKPIAVTLNFLSADIVFDAITVFDIDFGKFHVGSVTIMGQIEWCLANGRNILDFSKGHFEYKEKWATRVYPFEYHLYFKSSSLPGRSLAMAYKLLLELKQRMRDRHINDRLHRLTYRLKNRKEQPETEPKGLKTVECEPPANPELLTELDPWKISDAGLWRAILDFLYLNEDHINQVRLYEVSARPGSYLLQGALKCVSLDPA